MRTFFVLFIGIGIASQTALGQCHLDFVNTFWPAGFDGQCHAAVVFDDGTGPALYVGGNFEMIGNRPVNRIARWDGARWQSLGRGLEMQEGEPGHAFVSSMVVHDEDGDGPQPSCLIVGGWFTFAGGEEALNVARWDGQDWSSVGSGLSGDGQVNALLSIDLDDAGPQAPQLVAAGDFEIWSEGSTSFRVGIWNGQIWSGLGDGLDNNVYALAAFDPDGSGSLMTQLFAGGEFFASGSTIAPLLARWDPTAGEWQPVGDVLDYDGGILALASFDPDGSGPAPSRLFAGGDFNVGYFDNLAAWNGVSWASAGHPNARVSHLYATVENGQPTLLASGAFNWIGGANTGHIARWNGIAWSFVMPHAPDGALIHFDDNPHDATPPSLYALATVAIREGVRAERIARWDGSAWSAVVPGTLPRTSINAIEAFDTDGGGPMPPSLYVAGSVTRADGYRRPSVERWDGVQWTDVPMPPGMSYYAFTLATFDDGSGPALYVAGNFRQNDNGTPGSILRWDGSEWSALDGAPAGGIYSLVVHDDGTGPALYAGGEFQDFSDPDAPIELVARWDGQQWSALGFGLTGGFVTALARWDPDESGPLPAQLIATGSFLYSGSRQVSRVAAWDGVTWSRLGDGLPRVGWAAIAHNGGTGNHLYVSGDFLTSDYRTTTRVARWDGSDWLTIGDDFPPQFARAFASFDEDGPGPLPAALYVGGARRFDGASWTWLDGYPGTSVEAMRVVDDGGRPRLFLGGPLRNISELTRVGPPGDLDGDLSIGISDLAVLLAHFGTTLTAAPFEGDLDGDTDVDLRDLTRLFAAFGETCPQ